MLVSCLCTLTASAALVEGGAEGGHSFDLAADLAVGVFCAGDHHVDIIVIDAVLQIVDIPQPHGAEKVLAVEAAYLDDAIGALHTHENLNQHSVHQKLSMDVF